MNRDVEFITDGAKYIMAAVFLILAILVLSLIPRRGENYDTWLVEVHVIEKEVVQIDGEDVYILRTEDRHGKTAVYEITKNALNERLTVDEVYNEIGKGKYYRFRIGKEEDYDCHYPCICGASTLIEGFDEK